MFEVYTLLRAIHVIAAGLWLGEVMVINFVLLPALSKLVGEVRKQVITSVFPRVFILASILSATVVISGLIMLYVRFAFITNETLETLVSTKWGISILIGGTLGLAITLFHFFLEDKLAKKIILGKQGDEEKLAEVHLKMKVVPRIGLTVLFVIFLLMINASHSFV